MTSHNSSAKPLRAASFFTGIGGFDLGFQQAGFEITFQCEIDPFCNDILQKHWPEVTRLPNIKEMSNAAVPVSDVWFGGFPDKTSQSREWGRELGLKGPDLDSFMTLLDYLLRAFPVFLSSKMCQVFSLRTKEEISKPLFERWPTSGIVSDGVCLTAKASESPSHAVESTLSDVIETGEVPSRYFLSPNAAKGMLRRANQMGRPLFPPLRKSLEILSMARSSKE